MTESAPHDQCVHFQEPMTDIPDLLVHTHNGWVIPVHGGIRPSGLLRIGQSVTEGEGEGEGEMGEGEGESDA